MNVVTKIGRGGRVVIPASMRKALGLKEQDEVSLVLEDGELRLFSRETALKKARELVARYIPKDVSLVDELIADRRREVEREAHD